MMELSRDFIPLEGVGDYGYETPQWKDKQSKTYSRRFPVSGHTYIRSSVEMFRKLSEENFAKVEREWKMKKIAEKENKASSRQNDQPPSSNGEVDIFELKMKKNKMLLEACGIDIDENENETSSQESDQPPSSYWENGQPPSSYWENGQPQSSSQENGQPPSSYLENGQPSSSSRENCQPPSSSGPKILAATSGSIDFLEEPTPECSTTIEVEKVEEPRPKRKHVKQSVPALPEIPISRPVCPIKGPIVTQHLMGVVTRKHRPEPWLEPGNRSILGPHDLRVMYGNRLAKCLMESDEADRYRNCFPYVEPSVASVRKEPVVALTSTPVSGQDHTIPALQGSQSGIRQPGSMLLAPRVHGISFNVDGSIYPASPHTSWASSAGGVSWRKVIRIPEPRASMLTRFSCEEAGTISSSVVFQEQRSFLSSLDGFAMKSTFLKMCGQSAPQAFDTFFPEDVLDTCQKIGEGSFGEVFLITKDKRPQAVKIIPIDGTVKYNGCDQLTYRDILCETTVAKKLSDLRKGGENCCSTFMEVYEIHCVVGPYPARMRKEWDIYHSKWTSDNDNPNIFQPDQTFAVMVGEHCGTTLEDFIKEIKPKQTFSAIWQLCLSLAAAETAMEFEHRDLHLGNILVRYTDLEELNFMVNGVIFDLPTNGIRISIIDYSLSRILVDNDVLYVNLAEDEVLFKGKGRQYDVYRSMRQNNENNWKQHNALSNVQWLSYVCDTLKEGMIQTTWNYQDQAEFRRLASLNAEISASSSAVDLVGSRYIPAMEEHRKRNAEWAQRRSRMCRRTVTPT